MKLLENCNGNGNGNGNGHVHGHSNGNGNGKGVAAAAAAAAAKWPKWSGKEQRHASHDAKAASRPVRTIKRIK
ncbi:hypothetical protein ACLKA6_013033 [Drosophila palustris]